MAGSGRRSPASGGRSMPEAILSRVDHLVYGTSDLAMTVDDLERTLGVRAMPGGRHVGEGTHNALLALGPREYLEILAPDPEQPAPSRPRWLGIDDVTSPRLVAWAAAAEDLERTVEEAAAAGVELGEVRSGRRAVPDGPDLVWRLTDPRLVPPGGVVPFFIDWETTTHPAALLPGGLTLVDLRAEHPEPAAVAAALRALGLPLSVERGADPSLIATLATLRGRVELR